MKARHLLPILILATRAAAQTCPAPPASTFPAAPAAFTHTALADGTWNVAGTWNTGTVPGNNAIVCIPSGVKVTVNSQEAARLRHIQVNGELRLWIHSSTRLYVDTVFIASEGAFKIGEIANPVKPAAVAELVFISWDGNAINRAWDASEKSRGLVSAGTVAVYGDPKTHMVPMTADALTGATSLTLDSAPTNWKVGDNIMLTGSYFRRVGTLTSSQDEKLTITSVSGNVIGFTPALAWDHVRPRSDLKLHVANLTRNIVLRSESTSTALRGHVMTLNSATDIRHAALQDLGRTEKALPLDDFTVALVNGGLDYTITPTANNLITNRRGRYALHLHQHGTVPGSAPPAKVYGTVVERTTSWAFASHNSHVDFQFNVAYDFVGAGFVTESGNELGNFDNNIAIRGTGDGDYRDNRLVFANAERPQPLADFAFSGDGFWFQGPALRVRDNVASGCDGAGMIWFTTGSPDVEQLFTENGLSHNRYTHFPKSAIATVYAGFSPLPQARHWDHSVTDEKKVISDLPILELDGFEGYGNLVGFRLRFNNHDNVAWYTEDPFDYDDHLAGTASRVFQNIRDLKLWNNEIGFRPNYTSKGAWSDVAVVNRLDYSAQNPHPGAIINFQILNSSFNNLTIDGYEVAGWIENDNANVRNQITFSGTKSYLRYANFDTWTTALSCPVPTGVSYSAGTVSWSANAAHKRYLVRYRRNGDQQWKLIDTTATSAALTGLVSGTYTYQVAAGCKDGTGKETAPSSYTTAATFVN